MANTAGAGKLLTQQRKKKFLEVLRATGVVLLACKAAGVSRQASYNWRMNKRSGEKFTKLWEQAVEDKLDELEEVVLNAATGGDRFENPDPEMAFKTLARLRYRKWGNVEKHQVQHEVTPITIKFGDNMAGGMAPKEDKDDS